jgi:hypothetical protein
MADDAPDVDPAEQVETAPVEIDEPQLDDDDGVLDGMRGTGVGVEDPNIVGDVGPTDVPPGRDPDGGLIVTAEEGEDPQAFV